MTGRKKVKYVPFEEARELIHRREFASRKEYWVWYDREQPVWLPKYPHRGYKEQWVSWNDFLGTSNAFGNKGKLDRSVYRPYWDAVRFVQTLKLKTAKEYFQWARGGERPDDIPEQPVHAYGEQWTSWFDWLGKNVHAQQEAAKQTAKRPVIALAVTRGQPANIVKFVRAPSVDMLKERWDNNDNGIAVYSMPEDMAEWNQIVEMFTSDYYGDPATRVVPNINELVYRLNQVASRVTE